MYGCIISYSCIQDEANFLIIQLNDGYLLGCTLYINAQTRYALVIIVNNEPIISYVISTAIEMTLLKLSNKEYDIFIKNLHDTYGLHLIDCYKNPEAVKDTLKTVYGDFSIEIIDIIENELHELSQQQEYSKFIDKLRS